MNCDPNNNNRHVFKYDHPVAAIIVLAAVKAALLFFSVVEIMASQYFGALICFAGLVLFILADLLNIFMTADIVVDENGISRTTFGKVWQSMAWRDVRIIKVFDKIGRKGRSFNIYPILKQDSGIFFSGKMAFGDEMGRSDDFFCLLNSFILRYNINIESTIGGIKTNLSQL